MKPIDTHSPHRHREPSSSNRAIHWIAIGLTLLICCCGGFLMFGFIFGRPGPGPSTTYTYRDFEIFGPLDEARELRTKETLPTGIVLEATDGRRVTLSSINWKSARGMVPNDDYIQDAGNGTVWLQLFDPIPYGKSILTVEFTSQQFKSLTAHEHVTIHNMANGQSVALPAKWPEIERCFGKPIKKS
jgi:hypothetical protein